MAADARAETAGLVVVGASVGGLVAAILAADRGRRVVVLEPELAHALARESGPLVDWLTDRCGVAFELVRHAAPGHSAPRLHAPEGSGAGLVAALARAASR